MDKGRWVNWFIKMWFLLPHKTVSCILPTPISLNGTAIHVFGWAPIWGPPLSPGFLFTFHIKSISKFCIFYLQNRNIKENLLSFLPPTPVDHHLSADCFNTYLLAFLPLLSALLPPRYSILPTLNTTAPEWNFWPIIVSKGSFPNSSGLSHYGWNKTQFCSMLYKALTELARGCLLNSVPLLADVNIAVMTCASPPTPSASPSRGRCTCPSLCLPSFSSMFSHGWFPPFTQICLKGSSEHTCPTLLSKTAPALVSFSFTYCFI